MDMDKLIYCYDEELKDALSKKGFKCYNSKIGNRDVWLFEENDAILKYMRSQKLNSNFVTRDKMYF